MLEVRLSLSMIPSKRQRRQSSMLWRQSFPKTQHPTPNPYSSNSMVPINGK
jgi:hypothetical protein